MNPVKGLVVMSAAVALGLAGLSQLQAQPQSTSTASPAVAVITLAGSFEVPAAHWLKSQSPVPATGPIFEVASIRENTTHAGGGGIRLLPGRFSVMNINLARIILYGYGVRPDQVVGMPDWARVTPFDINATYAGPPAPEPQVKLMLRRLLAERLRLVAHLESRELPVYSLVLARTNRVLGPGLVRSEGIDCEKWLAEGRPQIGAGGPSPVAPGGKRPQCMLMGNGFYLSGGTQTMEKLATTLQPILERNVIDNTASPVPSTSM